MSNSYTIGRGEIWFDRYINQAALIERGERYLGNTPSLSVTLSPETIEHFNSDRGFKDKDESVTLSNNITLAFSTDNIDPANVALFFSGRNRTLAVAAQAAGTSTFTRVAKGLTYQIGATDALPSGLRTLTSVTVKKGVTTLVENTDYTVDLELGRVTLLKSSTAVSTGDDITVEYVSPAQNRTQVISGKDAVGGALRFISFNALGEKMDYFFPYVKLRPSGEFALKGDEFQVLTFDVEVLKKDTLEHVYIDGRPATL